MGVLENRIGKLERSGPTGGWRGQAVILARRPRFVEEATEEERLLVARAAARLLRERGLDPQTVTARELDSFLGSASPDVRAVVLRAVRIVHQSRQQHNESA